MRRKNQRITDDADRVVKDIKRQTRRRFSAEEKIRIVLAGLRGDESIAELCRQEGIAQSQYYSWCLGPLKLCHYLSVTGGTRDGPETVFR